MATDFDITKPATCPAFFFHLGDVIYGPNKDQQYRPEFYMSPTSTIPARSWPYLGITMEKCSP